MADIIISGYHGFTNSGDEALLFAILKSLREKEPYLEITVLSKTPHETAREYGVKSINRYNLFAIVKEMKHSKMLLFGGGSLLQDVTSWQSILYYLTVILLAQKLRLKTMLYANGIGPIQKRFNRVLARHILNKVDIITLRDDKSDEELKKLRITAPLVEITADPTFTIDLDLSLSGRFFTDRAGVAPNTKLCVVSIRKWKKSNDDFCDELSKLCDYMVEKYDIYPLFVPFQYPQDLDISEQVMSKMKYASYIINRPLTVAEMFSVLSEAEITIGMRLHSLIYATALKIPALAFVYDPKVSAFMDSINQPDWVNVETFSARKTREVLDMVITTKDIRKVYLSKTNAALREMAEKNADYAIRLLHEAK